MFGTQSRRLSIQEELRPKEAKNEKKLHHSDRSGLMSRVYRTITENSRKEKVKIIPPKGEHNSHSSRSRSRPRFHSHTCSLSNHRKAGHKRRSSCLSATSCISSASEKPYANNEVVVQNPLFAYRQQTKRNPLRSEQDIINIFQKRQIQHLDTKNEVSLGSAKSNQVTSVSEPTHNSTVPHETKTIDQSQSEMSELTSTDFTHSECDSCSFLQHPKITLPTHNSPLSHSLNPKSNVLLEGLRKSPRPTAISRSPRSRSPPPPSPRSRTPPFCFRPSTAPPISLQASVPVIQVTPIRSNTPSHLPLAPVDSDMIDPKLRSPTSLDNSSPQDSENYLHFPHRVKRMSIIREKMENSSFGEESNSSTSDLDIDFLVVPSQVKPLTNQPTRSHRKSVILFKKIVHPYNANYKNSGEQKLPKKNPPLIERPRRKALKKVIPDLRVPVYFTQKIVNIKMTDEALVCYQDFVCCQTTATYPMIRGERAGDPICDYYNLRLFDKVIIAALADGCNWGRGPREAASRACLAFTEFLDRRLPEIRTSQQIGRLLLKGFSVAHHAIIAQDEDNWDCGTATLLGGLLLPVDFVDTEMGDERRWGFIFGSVGDCKAFIWSPKKRKMKDITYGNRQNVLDPSNCGGRLGPYVNQQPDLSNFKLYFQLCEENDLVLLVSDGLHDNFDPQLLGLRPNDIGLPETRWEDVESEHLTQVKNSYQERFMEEVLLYNRIRHSSEQESQPISSPEQLNSPVYITQQLVQFCKEITKKSRDYMQEPVHQDEQLPTDYYRFPGKMDHVSCICFRACTIPTHFERNIPSRIYKTL